MTADKQAVLPTRGETANVVHGEGLAAYKRYATRDLDEAEHELSRLLAPGHLHVRPEERQRFDATAHYAAAESIGVGFMRFGSAVSIERPSSSPSLGVAIPLKGAMRVWNAGRFVEVPASRSMVVVPPDEPHRAQWDAGCVVLTFQVSPRILATAARDMRDGQRGDGEVPRFEHQVISLDEGHVISSTARFLAETFGRYRSVEEMPWRLLQRLTDHASSAILLGLPHSQTDSMLRPQTAAPSHAVSAAIQLINEESSAEFNVGELAHHVGVGVRALELGFRKTLDETPRQFLMRTRLHKAHEELRCADPKYGSTVTEIAARWGFFHAGRFATRYKKVFGALPSSTLKSSGASASSQLADSENSITFAN